MFMSFSNAAGRYCSWNGRAPDTATACCTCPAGNLDEGEPVTVGAAREAHEEIGIHVDPSDLRLAVVVHHRAAPRPRDSRDELRSSAVAVFAALRCR